MITETVTYDGEWKYPNETTTPLEDATIVFLFGESKVIKEAHLYASIKVLYPKADIVGCSSSGNILGSQLDESLAVATAVSFEKGSVEIAIKDFTSEDDIQKVSEELIAQLAQDGLKHLFILSDGLNGNGSLLAKGVNRAVNYSLPITGGLAADGKEFEETWVIANGKAKQNRIVAVGFYGEALSITHGCYAGWEEFGIYRRITKSKGNIVYEIDGQPALALYKKYLGEYADGLPGSGLQFPFNVKNNFSSKAIIRSVLAINKEDKSLIFAGDVSEGSYARLMKADIDSLIDGSQMAAHRIEQSNTKNALGLVVSCVGRRYVLNQLIDEEIETMGDILGQNVQLIGFYSYGELAPYSDKVLSCELHNQTMTLTVIYEE